jgi:hypothetical protein
MLIYKKVMEYCVKEKHDNINQEPEELDGRAQQSSGQPTAGQGGTGASHQGASQAAAGQGPANGAGGHVGAEAVHYNYRHREYSFQVTGYFSLSYDSAILILVTSLPRIQ